MSTFWLLVFVAFVVVFALFFLAVLITLNSAVNRVRRESLLLRQRRRLDDAWRQLSDEERGDAVRRYAATALEEERNRELYDGGGW